MICYRCNGTLDPRKDTCSKCGADIKAYKKIIYLSNRYYNSGLEKAKVHNLTGAREDLEQCLFLYKEHTQARNLLGLVFYAIGEPAEALRQWVISKNLSRDSRVADRYINYMRHAMRESNSEVQGVKKLNQAIEYLKNDSGDLALIQLKKLCSAYPHMTKAHNLLALVYIRDGKRDQAKKLLQEVLSVDSGDRTATHYMNEIEKSELENGAKNVGMVGDDDREQLIIPVRFRDYGTYLANALYILLGLALGVLIAWFVIVPGRVEKQTEGLRADIASYEAKVSDLNRQLEIKHQAEAESTEVYSIETTEVETSTEEEDDGIIEKLPKKPVKNASWSLNQDAVEQCVYAINQPDYPTAIKTFMTIDPAALSETNKEHYRNILILFFDRTQMTKMMTQAQKQYNQQQYGLAANSYDALSLLFPEDGQMKIMAGLSYEHLGKWDVAANRYWQAAVLYPNTTVGAEGRQRYLTITGNTEVPPLSDDVDIAGETMARRAKYYLDQMTNPQEDSGEID